MKTVIFIQAFIDKIWSTTIWHLFQNGNPFIIRPLIKTQFCHQLVCTNKRWYLWLSPRPSGSPATVPCKSLLPAFTAHLPAYFCVLFHISTSEMLSSGKLSRLQKTEQTANSYAEKPNVLSPESSSGIPAGTTAAAVQAASACRLRALPAGSQLYPGNGQRSNFQITVSSCSQKGNVTAVLSLLGEQPGWESKTPAHASLRGSRTTVFLPKRTGETANSPSPCWVLWFCGKGMERSWKIVATQGALQNHRPSGFHSVGEATVQTVKLQNHGSTGCPHHQTKSWADHSWGLRPPPSVLSNLSLFRTQWSHALLTEPTQPG